ncbi:MAG TPA: hypothetical protein PL123_00785 [Bacteroidales bacterium]|nr:hypothetical protein [Bacteroidales bacterium]
MKSFAFSVLFYLIVFGAASQNLVGYTSGEIVAYMKAKKIDMNRENVTNSTFRYLKYSDKYDTETVLFFLNPDSVCRSVRIVYNNSIKSSKIRELDSMYSRTGEKAWKDMQKGKNYIVKLSEDDYSFSVTIEPEK